MHVQAARRNELSVDEIKEVLVQTHQSIAAHRMPTPRSASRRRCWPTRRRDRRTIDDRG